MSFLSFFFFFFFFSKFNPLMQHGLVYLNSLDKSFPIEGLSCLVVYFLCRLSKAAMAHIAFCRDVTSVRAYVIFVTRV